MGSRFSAAIVDAEGTVRVNSEVMLKGWTESATGGQQFSLWLDNELSLHPFAGCRHRKRDEPGEMFRISLLEIDEIEVPDQRVGKVDGMWPSQRAHNLVVRNQMFVRYLKETKGHMRNDWDSALAKVYVKHVLNVESLSDLDKIPTKAQEYDEKIVKPFERWQGGH